MKILVSNVLWSTYGGSERNECRVRVRRITVFYHEDPSVKSRSADWIF